MTTTPAPVKLYYVPATRALRPRWLLEELEVPYELVRMDREKLRSPEYLQLHPLGKIPALVDGEASVFESAAIILYLADKHVDKGLAPPLGSPLRARYYQAIVFAMSEIEPQIAQIINHTVMWPEDKRVPAVAEAARKKFADVIVGAEALVATGPFILGESFSAADVVFGSVIGWARLAGLLEGHPKLLEYSKRLSARPAFKRARAD